MKNKIKVLRIITSIDPKFGGPSKTIIDSSIALSNQGFKIDILTADLSNSNFFKSKNIRIINKGPRFGNYDLNFKLFTWLSKHRNDYDLFIIHGIWEFNTLIARILLKKKYFVFTHGQLDPFFKSNLIKKIKKQIYWYFIEKKNLLLSRSLLLTSEEEKKSLNNTFVNTNGIRKTVVRYGINPPKFNKTKALKYFYKKLKKDEESTLAFLSARVGSITDNRTGGWYSYRASKASLNMMVKNFSIELGRYNKKLVVIGLHPGTVDSPLTQPFQKNLEDSKIFSSDFSVLKLSSVIDSLSVESSGKCIDWEGKVVFP